MLTWQSIKRSLVLCPMLIASPLAARALAAESPTLCAEGQKQQGIHGYLFGTFVEGRKTVYQGTGRDRGLKELTIFEESREIRNGDELMLPAGAERIALLFRHFGFHGENLDRIKEVHVFPFSPDKISRAVALGAEGGFNYKVHSRPKHLAKRAGSPNLIIDSAGGQGYASLINLAAPGGRIVNYGATVGPPEKLDLFKVFWKQLRLQGSTMGAPKDFADMLEFVERHGVKPVIDATFPLAKGNRALKAMRASPQFNKYVFDSS